MHCVFFRTFAAKINKTPLEMDLMGLPLWAWIVFYILVFLMLIADLKMFGKKGQHEVGISEALKMTAVWVGVSLLF